MKDETIETIKQILKMEVTDEMKLKLIRALVSPPEFKIPSQHLTRMFKDIPFA